MNHQGALMDSVSFATEQLLGITDQEKNVTEVLQNLADEAHLDRVYVLENRQTTRDAGFPVLHELGPELSDERRTAVEALRAKHIRKNAGLLEDGHALELLATSVSPSDGAALRDAGIEATLILPVFADGRWWGCLGMDQNSTVRGWSQPDIATFQATARVLGALLAHTNVEQQFRQFTGSIPVVFWIAAPDILHKTYVSPAYEQIWGRSRDGIRENPRSWMAAIYHDDYPRVSELLESNSQAEFDEEYRIIRGDRSVRWIRDTGFPVVDASGEVNRIVGIAQDITPQKEAEERLRASEEQIRTSLNEKEVLLKEIHHRVKNNLQVISSLLSLQAGKIRDSAAAAVFRDSQYRVRAMALVHERLYQSEDLARIDFAGYVQDMTSHLLRSYRGESRGIRLVSRVKGVSLDVDAAIPCALIINELVSNSLKYAFPEGQNGEIGVSLVEKDGSIVMTISDDGIGLPDATSFETSDSLGLQLVHSLTDQLGGTVVCKTDSGTQFEIRFSITDSPG
jgi:PAS domain S-box-containing protein